MQDAYAEEERYLRETLAMLKESYAKAAKPYLDRLAAIEMCRPPPPVFVSVETGTPTSEIAQCVMMD